MLRVGISASVVSLVCLSALWLNACSSTKPQAFRCVGQEPSWNIRISTSSPRVQYTTAMNREEWTCQSFSFGSDGSLFFQGSTEQGLTFTLVLRNERCTDIMSGQNFPYSATLELSSSSAQSSSAQSKQTLRGCAEPLPQY
jgi:uncharacterized membrane protein